MNLKVIQLYFKFPIWEKIHKTNQKNSQGKDQ